MLQVHSCSILLAQSSKANSVQTTAWQSSNTGTVLKLILTEIKSGILRYINTVVLLFDCSAWQCFATFFH